MADFWKKKQKIRNFFRRKSVKKNKLSLHSEKGLATLMKTGLIQLNPAFPKSGANIYLH